MDLRVTQQEKSLVLDLREVDELLKPIRDRFGQEKTDQVEDFLVKQAQLGIKQKSYEQATEPRLKQQLQDQITTLQEEMDGIRRQVGVYCMTYVRSIYPPESVTLWSNLERLVEEAQERPAQFDMWSKLQASADARAEADGGSTDQ